MSIAETRREQMFPCLSDAQIATAERFAPEAPRGFAPGEILFALGSHETAAWLVLDGGFDLVRRLPLGDEVPIASLVRGHISGEIGLVGREAMACVVDVSDFSSAARRRAFMTDFMTALHDANIEPLHLVLDEADLWAPQRTQPDGIELLGRVEEIVRRGRVRGFVPWLVQKAHHSAPTPAIRHNQAHWPRRPLRQGRTRRLG